MEMLKYFFTAYLNQSFGYDHLDSLINAFKTSEISETQLEFITELYQIIQTKNYAFANKIIDKYGGRYFKDLKRLEKLLNYIYDRLTDKPTTVKGTDFISNAQIIVCPSCSPEDKKCYTFSLIEKATIINNNMTVYVCKPCSLIWLTDNIVLEAAQDYKKYMKSLGLKGTWKELRDRDIY